MAAKKVSRGASSYSNSFEQVIVLFSERLSLLLDEQSVVRVFNGLSRSCHEANKVVIKCSRSYYESEVIKRSAFFRQPRVDVRGIRLHAPRPALEVQPLFLWDHRKADLSVLLSFPALESLDILHCEDLTRLDDHMSW